MKKIIAFVFILFFVLLMVKVATKTPLITQNQIVNLQLGTSTIRAEIADTDKKRQQGLSGRKYLAKDQGMLFVFDRPDYYGFWMKEMNFPIDLIWLNQDWKVVGINKDLRPDSYPQVFYPPSEVLYVLEINSGLIP